MSRCHTYSGITRDSLTQLRAEIAAHGLAAPAGDVGIMETHGVQISYRYDDSAQSLTLCIDRKPFYVRESQVWDVLDPTIRPFSHGIVSV
jgi:hypothetical protein